MTKRAYLVLGPESSGTRWLTRLLIAAGCVGSDDHDQPWDHALPVDETPVVWRRSFPHGDFWPGVALLVGGLRSAGYEVQALVMVRDWFAMSRSQAQFQPAEIVEGNIQFAYSRIFAGLTYAATPFVVVSYEAMVLNPAGYVNALLQHIGLEAVLNAECIEAVDGNSKWYEGVRV